VLNGVTLGMAKAEIDFLICRRRERGATQAGQPPLSVVSEPSSERKRRSGQRLPDGILLDALAMCEVKRDSSDLGFAVTKSSEVMAWLSGESGRYNANEWVNRYYPSGHFGLAADGVTERAHACTNSDGSRYLFDRASFVRFRTSDGGRLDSVAASGAATAALPPCLHIVTSTRRREGYDTVRPLSSKAFGKLQHKAARDLDLLDALLRDDAAEAYDWEGLRRWLREASGSLSAIGALRLFAASETAGDRLHVEVYQDEAEDDATVR